MPRPGCCSIGKPAVSRLPVQAHNQTQPGGAGPEWLSVCARDRHGCYPRATRAQQQWRQRVRRRTPLTSAEARTVAFMDIGTNSIRLLLVRLHPNHSYTILTELRQIVRLGEGEFASKHLQPAAMERTVRWPKSLPNWHAPMGQTRSSQWPRRPHAKPIIRTSL